MSLDDGSGIKIRDKKRPENRILRSFYNELNVTGLKS